jgi:hypothetical protein
VVPPEEIFLFDLVDPHDPVFGCECLLFSKLVNAHTQVSKMGLFGAGHNRGRRTERIQLGPDGRQSLLSHAVHRLLSREQVIKPAFASKL